MKVCLSQDGMRRRMSEIRRSENYKRERKGLKRETLVLQLCKIILEVKEI